MKLAQQLEHLLDSKHSRQQYSLNALISLHMNNKSSNHLAHHRQQQQSLPILSQNHDSNIVVKSPYYKYAHKSNGPCQCPYHRMKRSKQIKKIQKQKGNQKNRQQMLLDRMKIRREARATLDFNHTKHKQQILYDDYLRKGHGRTPLQPLPMTHKEHKSRTHDNNRLSYQQTHNIDFQSILKNRLQFLKDGSLVYKILKYIKKRVFINKQLSYISQSRNLILSKLLRIAQKIQIKNLYESNQQQQQDKIKLIMKIANQNQYHRNQPKTNYQQKDIQDFLRDLRIVIKDMEEQSQTKQNNAQRQNHSYNYNNGNQNDKYNKANHHNNQQQSIFNKYNHLEQYNNNSNSNLTRSIRLNNNPNFNQLQQNRYNSQQYAINLLSNDDTNHINNNYQDNDINLNNIINTTNTFNTINSRNSKNSNNNNNTNRQQQNKKNLSYRSKNSKIYRKSKLNSISNFADELIQQDGDNNMKNELYNLINNINSNNNQQLHIVSKLKSRFSYAINRSNHGSNRQYSLSNTVNTSEQSIISTTKLANNTYNHSNNNKKQQLINKKQPKYIPPKKAKETKKPIRLPSFIDTNTNTYRQLIKVLQQQPKQNDTDRNQKRLNRMFSLLIKLLNKLPEKFLPVLKQAYDQKLITDSEHRILEQMYQKWQYEQLISKLIQQADNCLYQLKNNLKIRKINWQAQQSMDFRGSQNAMLLKLQMESQMTNKRYREIIDNALNMRGGTEQESEECQKQGKKQELIIEQQQLGQAYYQEGIIQLISSMKTIKNKSQSTIKLSPIISDINTPELPKINKAHMTPLSSNNTPQKHQKQVNIKMDDPSLQQYFHINETKHKDVLRYMKKKYPQAFQEVCEQTNSNVWQPKNNNKNSNKENTINRI